MSKRKVKTVFERVIRNAKNEKMKNIYSWKGFLYCTDGYRIFKIKGDAEELNFDSKVIEADDLYILLEKSIGSDNYVSFGLPTKENLQKYAKEQQLKRTKGNLFKAHYELENTIHINPFLFIRCFRNN